DSSFEEELAVARSHFFQPRRKFDAFGYYTVSKYDPFDLLLLSTTDAVGNTVRVFNDYRTLQPYMMTDPNGNRQQVIFDEIGLVVGVAVMGKATEDAGDSLEGFTAIVSKEDVVRFLTNPTNTATRNLLGN